MQLNVYRVRGLLLLTGGVIGVVLLASMIASSGGDLPDSHSPRNSLALGAPGAAALWGAAELATGRSLFELESVWAALPRWQRLLGGIFFVVFGGVVAFTLVALVVA